MKLCFFQVYKKLKLSFQKVILMIFKQTIYKNRVFSIPAYFEVISPSKSQKILSMFNSPFMQF